MLFALKMKLTLHPFKDRTCTRASLPEPEKPKQPKLSKEEEIIRDKWTRLLEMVSKGRLDPLMTFWEREGSTIGGVDTVIPEWTGERWLRYCKWLHMPGTKMSLDGY